MGQDPTPDGIDRQQLVSRADALCVDDAGRADPASVVLESLELDPTGRGRLRLRFDEVVNHACRGIEERSERRETLGCIRRGDRIEVDEVIDWRSSE